MPQQNYHRGNAIGSFVVRKKIGEGQFSEVYEVEQKADGKVYALKIEKSRDVRTVKQEFKVLTSLQRVRQVCKLYGNGTEQGRSFFVMELLGSNLSEKMRRDFGSGPRLETAKAIALELLNALESVHGEGFIHRDVKPANFAVRVDDNEGAWVLIDFGLARRYKDDSGSVLAERTDASFRGSTMYASINAHQSKDLGRRDDLWSWFYLLVELIEGSLPWRAERDADHTAASGGKLSVEERKRECMTHPEQLVTSIACPPELLEINMHLSSLQFGDSPDYGRLRYLVSNLEGKVPVLEPALLPNDRVEGPVETEKNAEAVPKPVENGRSAEASPKAAGRAPLLMGGDTTLSPHGRASGEKQRERKRSRSPAPRALSRDLRQRGRDTSRSRSPRRRSRSSSPSRYRRDERRRRGGSRSRSRTPGRRRERESLRRESSRSRSPARRKDREAPRSRSPARRKDAARSRSPIRRKEAARSRSRSAARRKEASRSWSPAHRGEPQKAVLADVQEKYERTSTYLAMLRMGGISKEGAVALQHLRNVQPLEAVGVACLLIDELATGTQGKEASATLAPLLEEIAGYAHVMAARSSKSS